jgi:uncharacterized membrane protein (UPF0136 family)
MRFDNIVFWCYIILLLIGGLIGFFKGRSKVSLITSAVAAAVLVLTRLPGIFTPSFSRDLSDVVMAALLVIFAIRLAKSKRFIPSGLMLMLTVIVLALLNLRRYG